MALAQRACRSQRVAYDTRIELHNSSRQMIASAHDGPGNLSEAWKVKMGISQKVTCRMHSYDGCLSSHRQQNFSWIGRIFLLSGRFGIEYGMTRFSASGDLATAIVNSIWPDKRRSRSRLTRELCTCGLEVQMTKF